MADQKDVIAHNDEVLASLKPGDLIEFDRGLYSHLAVYCGSKDVIHIATFEDIEVGYKTPKRSIDNFVVRCDDFWEVADNCKAEKNNKNDERWRPYDIETIQERAKTKIGEEFDYNVVAENSDHFVKFCRYEESESDIEHFMNFCIDGKPESDQKDSLAIAARDDFDTHNRKVLATLKPGDLVEFDRGLYSHWAVYVGNGKVIHLAGDGNKEITISRLHKRVIICYDKISDITKNSKVKKYDEKDERLNPNNCETIFRRAYKLIGNIFDYNFLAENNDCFVNFCRYGKRTKNDQEDTPAMPADDDVNAHNREVLDSLERGDLVEFDRGLYSHWAVYIGDGKVVHVAGGENKGDVTKSSSLQIDKVVVRCDDFWNVTGNSKAAMNNRKDQRDSPNDVKTIKERALKMVGNVFNYSVLSEKSDYFVNFCRYGKPESDQKDSLAIAAREYVMAHNREVLESLERGDLVEFDRGIYSHWAVYVGDGKVVHVAGGGNKGDITKSNSLQIDKVVVRCDDFWNVTDNCKAEKNNKKEDERYSPYDFETIDKRAKEMIGKEFDINVLTENCDYFVNFCRYGKSENEQANTALELAFEEVAAVGSETK